MESGITFFFDFLVPFHLLYNFCEFVYYVFLYKKMCIIYLDAMNC